MISDRLLLPERLRDLIARGASSELRRVPEWAEIWLQRGGVWLPERGSDVPGRWTRIILGFSVNAPLISLMNNIVGECYVRVLTNRNFMVFEALNVKR